MSKFTINIKNFIKSSVYDKDEVDNKLAENLTTFVGVILKAKPSTVKGKYVKNISISSTMGPGIKLDVNSFDK